MRADNRTREAARPYQNNRLIAFPSMSGCLKLVPFPRALNSQANGKPVPDFYGTGFYLPNLSGCNQEFRRRRRIMTVVRLKARSAQVEGSGITTTSAQVVPIRSSSNVPVVVVKVPLVKPAPI